jgi:cytochrome c-type biogenesis protein CcmH
MRIHRVQGLPEARPRGSRHPACGTFGRGSTRGSTGHRALARAARTQIPGCAPYARTPDASIHWALIALLALGIPLLLVPLGHGQAAPPSPRAFLPAPRGTPVSGAQLDLQTLATSRELRCPVCQGLSIADSPAPMAVDMRNQVRDLLAQGYDEEQIMQYFERSYGSFVRLRPPLRGVSWLVWLAPAAGLIVGAFVLRSVFKRRGPTADEQTAKLDSDLAPYVLKVRELAHGWPGGVEPEAQKTLPGEKTS